MNILPKYTPKLIRIQGKESYVFYNQSDDAGDLLLYSKQEAKTNYILPKRKETIYRVDSSVYQPDIVLRKSTEMDTHMKIRMYMLFFCAIVTGSMIPLMLIYPHYLLLFLPVFFPAVGTSISMTMIIKKGRDYDRY